MPDVYVKGGHLVEKLSSRHAGRDTHAVIVN